MSRGWWGGLAAAAALPILLALSEPEPPDYVDELYWLGGASYAEVWCAPSSPLWELRPAVENPSLGRIALAFGLWLQGVEVPRDEGLSLQAQYLLRAFDAPAARSHPMVREALAGLRGEMSAAAWARAQRQPELRPELRRAGRWTARVWGAMACALMFAVASAAGGAKAGLPAALLLAIHPVFASSIAVCQVDALAAALSLAGLGALMAHEDARGWGWALLWGLALGLGAAVKPNAGLLGLLGAAMGLRHAARGAWREAGALAIGGGLSLLAFVALDPALWSAPLEGLAAIARSHAENAEAQRLLPDPAHAEVGPLPARMAALGVMLAGRAWLAAPLAWALILAARAVRAEGSRRVLLGGFLLNLAGVALWMPFAWSRYAQPVLIAALPLLGVGIVAVTERRRSHTAARL